MTTSISHFYTKDWPESDERHQYAFSFNLRDEDKNRDGDVIIVHCGEETLNRLREGFTPKK